MICNMLSLLEYIDHPRFHCNFISASDLIKFILTFSSVILISIGSMKLLEGLYITFFNDNNYIQLVSSFTTDNQTLMGHIYTNLPESEASSHILEIYFLFCYLPISQKRLHFDIISIHFVHILTVRHQI